MKKLFLCYRRYGAQTAKLFSFYMKRNHPEITVWYSDKEREGIFSLDPPELLKNSYGVVLFLSKDFTKGFLDKEGNINSNKYRSTRRRDCVTVQEVIEIERNLQNRKDFELHIINLDGAVFTETDQKILETVFKKAEIYKKDSIAHFAERNINPFDTARDHEDSFFDRMIGAYLPNDIATFVQGNLSIGNYITTIDVLCWDCKKFISPDQIKFELEVSNLPLYEKIEVAPYSMESLTQDDDVISVVQFEQSLTTNEEKKHLLIKCKLSKYHLFRKTLDIWNSNGFIMSKEIASYLNSVENDRLYQIPNAMGLAFMVVSADNKLVFSRRSKKRRVRSNEFDCSIVEGLLPYVDKVVGGKEVHYDYTTPDFIQNECKRAFCEEICIAQNLTVNIFGLILDRKYGQWNLVGKIHTDLSSVQIQSRHSTRDDTTEQNQLFFIDYLDSFGMPTISPIQDAVRTFKKDGIWDTALAVLVGTLTSLGFSREDIDTLL